MFATSQFRLCLLFAICIVGSLVSAERAIAEPNDDWDVMRVFIEEDDKRALIRNGYELIEIDELSRLLREEQARRKAALLEVPRLEEATYVARFENGTLLSDLSSWIFSGKTITRPLRLNETSVAIHPAFGLSSAEKQLVDEHAIDGEGHIELELQGGREQYWFGFSVLPTDDRKQEFRINLPIATNARMLIETAASSELVSDDVVVEKISSPSAFLPEDWRSESSLSSLGGSTTSQWWLVNLSGRADFSLTFRTVRDANENWFKHVVKSANIDYTAGEEWLDLTATFQMASVSSATPVRLRLSKHARISSVLADGAPLTWRVQPSLAGDSSLLELSGLPLDGSYSIEVAGAVPYSDQTELPEIAIAEAFTLQGRTRIFSKDDIVVDDARSSEGPLRFSTTRLDLPPDAAAGRLGWESQWIGVAPKFSASFSRRVTKWSARSLTRFAIQSEWLNASCRIRLDAPSVDSNELKMIVGEGWFVDKVELLGSNNNGLRSEFFERGADGKSTTDVVISWENNAGAASIEVEVTAHRPLTTNSNQIPLLTQRLLTVPNSDQVDNYVIEESGRYQAQVGANLLRYQLQPGDLPAWQQQLLPKLSDKWIFQGVRRSIPQINILESNGTYSSRLYTFVDELEAPSGKSTNGHFLLQIQPVAGTVDAIQVQLPNSLVSQTWEFANNDIGSSETIVPVILQTGERDSLVELNLQQPYSTPFSIVSSFPMHVNSNGEFELSVLGLPNALSAESTMVVPGELSEIRCPKAIEVLPATICCSDHDLLQVLTELYPALDLTEMIAARIELDASQSIILKSNATTRTNRAWVRDERIVHWMDGQSRRSHLATWNIDVSQAVALQIELPEGWEANHARLNGQTVGLDAADTSDPELGSSTQLMIQLPAHQRSVLELQCSSERERFQWLSREELPRPKLSLEVFTGEQNLMVPPNKIPIEEVWERPKANKLMDRLRPVAWWSWLSPDAQPEPLRNRQGGWSSVAGNDVGADAEIREVWVAERTAVATLVLAFATALTIGCWLLFGQSTRRAWLVVGVLLVALTLVPAALVGALQVCVLSAILAALVRQAQVVFRSRNRKSNGSNSGAYRTRPPEVGRESLPSTAARSLLFVCCAAGVTQQSFAQTVPNALTDESEVAESGGGEVFGVVIPLDEDRKPGAEAYIPNRLKVLLNQGAAGGSGFSEPRLMSANYMLRTNPTTSFDREPVQEFSAEFRIDFSQTDSVLRLPIVRSELQLKSTFVNGQTSFLSDLSVNQDTAGVVFRARTAGSYLVKLIFDPQTVESTDGFAQLKVLIPKVPSAWLRVISDASTRVEIDSVGQQQLSDNQFEVALGGVDRINVRWASTDEESSSKRSLSTVSRLWINAVGDQLATVGLLEVSNPAALREEFHLVIDGSWEPIGTTWGDVELITLAATYGKSRIYTVRLRRDLSVEVGKTASIRMYLAPRFRSDSGSIPLPFITLQEAGQSANRTFTWSASGPPIWFPEGIGFWPQLPASERFSWGDSQLATESLTYQVPAGSSLSTSLSRQTPNLDTAVLEANEVHLSLAEARIEYQADWADGLTRDTAIRLEIPSGARVESVQLDGIAAEYVSAVRDDRTFLIVRNASTASTIRQLIAKVSYPIRGSTKSVLPRIVLQDAVVAQSSYRLFRGAGLECRVEASSDPHWQFDYAQESDASNVSNAKLESLETLVGQAELASAHRSSCWLPCHFIVTRRTAAKSVEAVMYVDRTEAGWRARVKAAWNDLERPLDFAFFYLPAGLKDSLQLGSLRRRFIPSGNSNRITLCVVPPPPVNGRTSIEFEFPIATTSSSQSISIPDIQLLGRQPVSPVLALSTQVQNQDVLWSGRGIPVGPDWKDPFQPAGNRYAYSVEDPREQQIAWELVDSQSRSAQAMATKVVLQEVTQTKALGMIDYWLSPQGQLEFELELPSELTVVGTQIGGLAASANYESERRLSVLLQPNYLPVHIRVLAQWTRQKNGALQLPVTSLDGRILESPTIVELQTNDWSIDVGTRDTKTPFNLAQLWASTLVETSAVMAGLPKAERQAWMRGWHPEAVGFSMDETVVAGGAGNEEAAVPIGELWDTTCNQLDVAPQSVMPAAGEFFAVAPVRRTQFFTGLSDIGLQPVEEPSNLSSRLVAAGFLTAAVLLGLYVGYRVRTSYFYLLSEHPWVYWLQLAVFSWLFLPVMWPSVVLAFAAFGMAVSQLLDYRRAVQMG